MTHTAITRAAITQAGTRLLRLWLLWALATLTPACGTDPSPPEDGGLPLLDAASRRGDAWEPGCAFDLDGDGHIDDRCGGDDCDDENDEIHPGAPETCANALDDDCDGTADETGCGDALGSCEAPVEVTSSGPLVLAPLFGTNAASCEVFQDGITGEVLPAAISTVRIVLEQRASVRLRVTSLDSRANVMSAASCTEAVGVCTSRSEDLVLSSLEPGAHWIQLAWEPSFGPLAVVVEIDDPLEPSPNTTCEDALEVTPSATPTLIADQTMISSGTLFYRFRLESPRNFRATVYSHEGYPVFGSWEWLMFRGGSTRSELLRGCAGSPADRIAENDRPWPLEEWSLPAGEYLVKIDAPPPYRYDLELSFDAPTPILAGDRCSDPVRLTPGVPYDAEFSGYRRDGVDVCGSGPVPDWVGVFELTETRDVLVEMTGGGDHGRVGVSRGCDSSGSRLDMDMDMDAETIECFAHCSPADSIPRGACAAQVWRLPPGTYYVHARGSGTFGLTLRTSAPATPTPVLGSDRCETSRLVPVGRSRFSGRLETDGWTNSCFEVPGEAVDVYFDQLYRFELSARSRIRAALSFSYETYPIYPQLLGATRGAGACTDESPVCGPFPNEFIAEPGTLYLALVSQERTSYELDLSVEPL
jgi:hypothetical protein